MITLLITLLNLSIYKLHRYQLSINDNCHQNELLYTNNFIILWKFLSITRTSNPDMIGTE